MIRPEGAIEVSIAEKRYGGRYSFREGVLTLSFAGVSKEYSVGGLASMPMVRRLLRELIAEVHKGRPSSYQVSRSALAKTAAQRRIAVKPQLQVVYNCDLRGRWRWRAMSHDGHVINESDTTFDCREECRADAARCGYAQP